MHSDDEYVTSDAEDGVHPQDVPVDDPEVWFDYNSEFLAAAYHSLQDHIASMGVYVLDACTFPQFVEFCFQHSTGRKPPC